MNKQSKSTTLTGTPRDYPPPPDGFTASQAAWWKSICALLRQQDREMQALRDKLNTPPQKPNS